MIQNFKKFKSKEIFINLEPQLISFLNYKKAITEIIIKPQDRNRNKLAITYTSKRIQLFIKFFINDFAVQKLFFYTNKFK